MPLYAPEIHESPMMFNMSRLNRGIIVRTRGLPVGGPVAGPPVIPLYHYDATKITGLADAEEVTTWRDEMGNADLSNSGNYPTYETNTLNGKPVVTFAGTDWLENLSPGSIGNINDDVTIYAVMHIPWTENGGNMFSLSATQSDYRLNTFLVATSLFWRADGDDAAAEINPVAGTGWNIIFAHYEDASGDVRMAINDEADNSTIATVKAPVADTIYMGQGGGFGEPFSVAEFLIYDRVLTSEERIAVRNYLNSKWAVF